MRAALALLLAPVLGLSFDAEREAGRPADDFTDVVRPLLDTYCTECHGGEEAKGGAYFTVLFPSTQFVFAQDCAWWLAFQPQAVDRTKLTLGACFPRDTVALDDFE